jgi:hypothetical protein
MLDLYIFVKNSSRKALEINNLFREKHVESLSMFDECVGATLPPTRG